MEYLGGGSALDLVRIILEYYKSVFFQSFLKDNYGVHVCVWIGIAFAEVCY